MFEVFFKNCGHTCIPTRKYGKESPQICRTCEQIRQKEWRDNNPVKVKKSLRNSKEKAMKLEIDSSGIRPELRRKAEDLSLLKSLGLDEGDLA